MWKWNGIISHVVWVSWFCSLSLILSCLLNMRISGQTGNKIKGFQETSIASVKAHVSPHDTRNTAIESVYRYMDESIDELFWFSEVSAHLSTTYVAETVKTKQKQHIIHRHGWSLLSSLSNYRWYAQLSAWKRRKCSEYNVMVEDAAWTAYLTYRWLKL